MLGVICEEACWDRLTCAPSLERVLAVGTLRTGLHSCVGEFIRSAEQGTGVDVRTVGASWAGRAHFLTIEGVFSCGTYAGGSSAAFIASRTPETGVDSLRRPLAWETGRGSEGIAVVINRTVSTTCFSKETELST